MNPRHKQVLGKYFTTETLNYATTKATNWKSKRKKTKQIGKIYVIFLIDFQELFTTNWIQKKNDKNKKMEKNFSFETNKQRNCRSSHAFSEMFI